MHCMVQPAAIATSGVIIGVHFHSNNVQLELSSCKYCVSDCSSDLMIGSKIKKCYENVIRNSNC